ncbi:MAG: hypothetical protein ACJAYU_000495 [Bradymonadia bacterium]|jgi:hypothetical protein
MNTTTFFTIAAATALSVPAFAQSDCYKGECGELDTRAAGNNFGWLADELPARVTGTSGGGVDASYLGDTDTGPCLGNVTVLPDHSLHVHEAGRLQFEVESFQDTTLLIHGPDGWRCNDDSNDLSPGLTDYFAAGDYQIWVGSYERRHHDYRLNVSVNRNRGDHGHDHGTDGHNGHGGNSGNNGNGGQRSLDAAATTPEHESLIYNYGDGVQRMQGRAGGPVDVSRVLDDGCVGFTHSNPDHIITLTDRMDLEISVQSSEDTTLVVHGPHGWMCNDDYYDVYPGLDGSFPPGTYRIWVGTYEQLDSDDYMLTVSGAQEPDYIEPVVPMVATYTFSGRFEDLDVFFSGHDIDDLYRQCAAFMTTTDSDFIDTIVVNGQTWSNGPAYWSAENLCSIAALNAIPDIAYGSVTSGSIEDMVPFDIQCGDSERIIQRYLPTATTDVWIDDIVVNGQAMHNGPGFWTGQQAADIVIANITDPYALYRASGTMEGTAFSFSGDSPQEIQQQCRAFVSSAMDGEWIDDVTVEGQARHNSSGWWNESEICMMVGSLSSGR